jgi:hypothetical protein
MNFLEHLDETRVKDIDAMLKWLEAKNALQVACEMAGIASGSL